MKAKLFLTVMLALIGLSGKAQIVETKKMGNSESATVKMDFQLEKYKGFQEVNVSFSKNGIGINKEGIEAQFVSNKIKVPIKKPEPFLTLAAVWEAENYFFEDVTIQYRISFNGKTWMNWEEFTKDEHSDSKDDFLISDRYVSNLIYLDKKVKYIQYKISFIKESKAIIRTLRLDFFSPGIFDENGTGQKKSNIKNYQERSLLGCPCPSLGFISRTGWGCPDGQNSPDWLPETTIVTHFVVHHAAGYDTPPYAQQVLAMWHFHANIHGWGDIGYNWVIDPNGVLYQGRAWSGSNDNTIGAHMCGCNPNKMGVCLLGNFTSSMPTVAAYNTLKQLLAWIIHKLYFLFKNREKSVLC